MNTPDNSENVPDESSNPQERDLEMDPEPELDPEIAAEVTGGGNDEFTIEALNEEAMPYRFQSIKRVNEDILGCKEKPISDLRQNDYHPRSHLDPTELDAHVESIEQHGPTGLIVRPIEETAEYEVIRGRRELAALRRIHGEDSDWLVPCIVRDVDDREARLIMLDADDRFVGLTPAQKARVYAQLISVDYTEDDQSLAEYLDETRSAATSIKLPSNVHPAVEALAEELRSGADAIARRLRLLVVPDRLQRQVAADELPLRVAEVIADGLRNLDDPAARREQMLEVATETESSTPEELAKLRNRIETIREMYDQGEAPHEQIDALEQTRADRKQALEEAYSEALSWYNGYELTDELSPNATIDLTDRAELVSTTCIEELARLDEERVEPLTETIGVLTTDRDRATEHLQIYREEDRNSCVFCGYQEMSESGLESWIGHLDNQLTEKKAQKTTLSQTQEKLGRHARKLSDRCTEFEDACTQLEQARARHTEDEHDDAAGTGADDSIDSS